jgi:hypothetical protein
MGQPIFRLTWAENEFEYRRGTFAEFKGDLYVRTIEGVKHTPKYPHLKGFYIIEMWHPPEKCITDEIKDHNGYECLYAFKHPKLNEPLPLRLDVVQLILRARRTTISNMLAKSLAIQAIEDKETVLDKYTYDAIDPSSPIESALHFKEGVSYHGLEIPNAKTKKSI